MVLGKIQKLFHSLANHPRLKKFSTLINAIDTFLFEPSIQTKNAPHIRDAVDLKRWMILVVVALLPCSIMAVWNSGVQQFVYTSGSFQLMQEYILASSSWSGYWDFILKNGRYLTILKEGLISFLPVLIISYAVGGFWEGFFAIFRKEEISEGFLVSGLLYPLILPPSLPYWMVALGVTLGIIVGKEIFGGTGMNILNPALTCRCFLYFGFPAYMTGEIWAGRNTYLTNQSVFSMNQQAASLGVDGISQQSPCGVFNIPYEVKNIHVDAIAHWKYNQPIDNLGLLERYFHKWTNFIQKPFESFSDLSLPDLQEFLSASQDQGGLGFSLENFPITEKFASLKYGLNLFSDGNLFWGNRLGSFGETSIIACLIGAAILIAVGVGSWRTMVGVSLGLLVTAFLLKFGSNHFFPDGGAWVRAQFDFPIYKHFLMGSAVFGLVFMATDPVSSPSMRSMQWIYGFLIGVLTIVIRSVNPAYPEGVMLAILFANVFAPLFDFYAVRFYRRRRRVLRV